MPTNIKSAFEQSEMQEIAEAVLRGTVTDAHVIEIELSGGLHVGEYYMHSGKEGALPESLILECRLLGAIRLADVRLPGPCHYVAIVKNDDNEWRVLNQKGVPWHERATVEPTFESLVSRGLLLPPQN